MTDNQLRMFPDDEHEVTTYFEGGVLVASVQRPIYNPKTACDVLFSVKNVTGAQFKGGKFYVSLKRVAPDVLELTRTKVRECLSAFVDAPISEQVGLF